MNVQSGAWLQTMRPVLQQLLARLLERYAYASVLASDVDAKDYSVSARGTSIAENNTFGKRGFVVRVHENGGYAEYSANSLDASGIPEVLERIESELKGAGAFARYETPVSADEPLTFVKSTSYEKDPKALGDEAVVTRLNAIREKGLSMDERLLDVSVRFSYQFYHKLFLSKNRDLEQNVLWTSAALAMVARKGQEIKDSYRSMSLLGGAELLDSVEEKLGETCKTVIDLLESKPLTPGEYECVCTPEVTGMIVHEAFGHGVEMDMFVKDRALAKNFIGEYVASPLVTMYDGAATGYEDVATYFFDDEGNTAGNTLIIDKGVLKTGICDEVSAARLNTAPTGNGRREAVDHKAYTRMTNTWFTEGDSTVEEMIASVKDGLLLEEPSSGMEDPKNWGIQCMVSFAREIKDGKLTGRIFSPIVLSGYVPDLLKSISMVSQHAGHSGGGACGKGWKEWVKVSDGGPWIKARIRLG
ncbi:MAG: TldD/PmbA family protein [Lachnospiraceae bacterium]|nr:TldD/PmbA family protein [Lachnospiraceae bacterium]